jgi:hypothetical protein
MAIRSHFLCSFLEAAPEFQMTALASVGVAQHPDEHGPDRPILLAVDQELGEGAALWVPPELAASVGPLEVAA